MTGPAHSPQPDVELSDTADDLARSTATRAVAALNGAVAARGEAHLVVTGGSILEAVLHALASPGIHDAVDWSKVHVWWGDERFVPAGSDDRNDKPAGAALFDHVPARLHPMPASGGEFGDDAEAAAAAYVRELADAAAGADVPAFDVVLLGLGPDGHCASLFPGHPGTQVRDRSVIAVHDSPKPPPTRLSLTFPALDAAQEIWFVASGEGKADAVARALAGADPTDVPSAGPHGRLRTRWLIDLDAARAIRPF